MKRLLVGLVLVVALAAPADGTLHVALPVSNTGKVPTGLMFAVGLIPDAGNYIPSVGGDLRLYDPSGTVDLLNSALISSTTLTPVMKPVSLPSSSIPVPLSSGDILDLSGWGAWKRAELDIYVELKP